MGDVCDSVFWLSQYFEPQSERPASTVSHRGNVLKTLLCWHLSNEIMLAGYCDDDDGDEHVWVLKMARIYSSL